MSIEFDAASIKGMEIRKEAGYGGVRIDIQATLDGARISLQVDIGFGDAVTPEPLAISYPILLDDQTAPQLRAYPKYTVVAEKFQALCALGMANSRMKDYFDLWVLLRENDLDKVELRRAIEATFARRQTPMPTATPVGLSDGFLDDTTKQLQWRAFLRKNKLNAIDLYEVVTLLRKSFQEIGVI